MRRILVPALAGCVLVSFVLNAILARSHTNSSVPKLPENHVAQPRMGLVNMGKLLKEYKEGKVKGDEVLARRQEVIDQINAKHVKITVLQGELLKTQDKKTQTTIQAEIQDLTHTISDMEKEAVQEMKEISDQAVVECYQKIKKTIAAIAEANNLDMVWTYVDFQDVKDEQNADLVRSRINFGGAMPIYHTHVEITAQVLQMMNDDFAKDHAQK